MAFNERLLSGRNKRTKVELVIPIPCDICGQYVNVNCVGHNAEIEEIDIVIKPLSWMRQQEIRANSFVLNAQTQNVQFSLSEYITGCLSEMVVEAPWGDTNEIFMSQVGPELGAALEEVVPPLDGSSSSQKEGIEQIKKAQNS